MSSEADDQCKALTQEGERCSRSAQEDGFCAQHGESDRTIEDTEESDDGDDETTEEDQDEDETMDESGEEDTSTGGDESGDGEQPETPASDIMSIRESVETVGHEIIGHRIDGIVEITRDGDGWRASVEVVERSSVPDTQDLLGKYDIELDADGRVAGYRRVDRYRRDDTDRDGHLG
ncbi:gas vesicle protein [Halobacteriales archaeon QS_5_70_15]|nr:MAG: gas vesicle protein [Halobacteriales archaeon QS_5_70_15]